MKWVLAMLHIFCVYGSLDYLKLDLKSNSRLPIPQFIGHLYLRVLIKNVEGFQAVFRFIFEK